MLPYPKIDPDIFSIGPLHVRWYGLMYVLGFIASYVLVKKQIKNFGYELLNQHFENLNFVLILSVILGGRLGYVLFYNLPYYMNHPLQIFATWEGGMSFHGACIALIASGWFYTRRHGIDYWKAADLYVATVPIGLGLGRIGNFINGELFGRPTSMPWGMIFPNGGPVPRHPSQLYEAALEGVVLFCILWSCKNKPWRHRPRWPHGSILSLFLICYGLLRITVEQFRQPDPQLGYLFGVLTMGQILSFFMVMGGAVLWLILLRRK